MMHAVSPDPDNARKKTCLIIAGLLSVGLGIRIFGAWCLQFAPNSDYGMVGLMAKHMVEGVDYPIFFYGQCYMGTLEPMVSAVFYKIFNGSGFAVCLGTAWLGFLLLPALYAWTCDIKNRTAARATLLFSIVGSFPYVFYFATPRGGYASMMLLGTLTLWLGVRLTQQADTCRFRFWIHAILMGLCAGLGWWSNQLIVPFFIATLLLLLVRFKTRTFNPALLLGGGLSFFIASLPWWMWNYMHQWRTFQFGGSLTKIPLVEGLKLFAGEFFELADCADKPWPIIALGVACYLILFLAYLKEAAGQRKRNRHAFLWLLSPLFLLFGMALVYSASSFARLHCVRYVLPAYPAIAVMVGIGTARLAAGRWTGWLPLLVIIVLQLPTIVNLADYRGTSRSEWQTADRIAAFLNTKNINVIYGNYAESWMNFATREKLCMVKMDDERYPPYERRAATAKKTAFFADHLYAEDFLKTTGARADREQIGKHIILYNIEPPKDAIEAPAHLTQTVLSKSGQTDLTGTLSDCNLDTKFACPLNAGEEIFLEWTLKTPARLCGIRGFNYKHDYPRIVRIDARRANARTWETVLKPTYHTGLFWSGRHIYWLGLSYFMEIRFPEDDCAALRIYFSPGKNRPQEISLGEIRLLQPAAATAPPEPDLQALQMLLKTQGVERLYAPRWISEKIYQDNNSSIQTFVPDLYTRDTSDKQEPKDAATVTLDLQGRKTALLALTQHAEQTRYCLQTTGITAEEIAIPPWILFICPRTNPPAYPACLPIQWSETGCFLAPQQAAKTNAYVFYARSLSKTISPSTTMELLKKTLACYPSYQPALETMIQCHERAGRKADADICRAELQRQTQPRQQLNIRFPYGIELIGINAPKSVKRGETFPIDYYWKCPPGVKAGQWAVFIHFLRDKKSPFQDDHVLMENILNANLSFQPFEEIFRVTRLVNVPHGIEPGDYQIRMGIYNRETYKRLSPSTGFPKRKNAVMTPVMITVTE